MRDAPSDVALLQAARDSVANMLLHLPVAARDEARLVIQALDCVARRVSADPTWEAEAKAEIAGLCDRTDMALVKLSRDIRAGVFEADPVLYSQVRDLLERMTAKKLAEDNPHYPR